MRMLHENWTLARGFQVPGVPPAHQPGRRPKNGRSDRKKNFGYVGRATVPAGI